MKPSFNAYTFTKKTLMCLILLCIVGFTVYYSYNIGMNLLLPDQVQNTDIDPLDDSGNDIYAQVETVNSPVFLKTETQTEVSDVQKAKTLGIIKANDSISDAKKKQIMDELNGGKR